MIFKIIQELNEKGVHIVAIKNNFNLNPEDKNNGIISNVLMFAFGLSAQIERDLISERTKMGLSIARLNGKRIGRQKGEIVYNVKLRRYQKDIMYKYNVEKESINSLAKHYKVKWSTMKKFLTVYSKMEKPIKQNVEIEI
jgi:DNA invertase Pin-like site-specific DNA recombinase